MPLTPIEIARLEEHRQAVGTADIATQAVPIAGGWMCYEAPDSWSNLATGLGLTGPVSEGELDALVAFYEDQNAEPAIDVCPFVDASLVSGLATRGFVLREFENVFAREIGADEDLRGGLQHAWPNGLTFERVDADNKDQVAVFADVSSIGFRPEGSAVAESDLALTTRIAGHPQCDSYLALVDGRLAGGGSMETRDTVGCLFGTSVVPEFRRRGIQAALIARRLERARERGGRLMCIHSRPGIATERNAARVGFALAYTKVLMVKPCTRPTTAGSDHATTG